MRMHVCNQIHTAIRLSDTRLPKHCTPSSPIAPTASPQTTASSECTWQLISSGITPPPLCFHRLLLTTYNPFLSLCLLFLLFAHALPLPPHAVSAAMQVCLQDVRAQKHACLHTYTFSYLFDVLSLSLSLSLCISLSLSLSLSLSHTHTHTHTHTFQGKRIAADCVKRRLLQLVEDHNAPCFSNCISSGLGWHGSECYIRYMYVSVNICVYVCIYVYVRA
jgi:hypothetical protein